MQKIDMSAEAVTTRLKRISQLRRLGLLLRKAKLEPPRTELKAAGRPPQTLKSVRSKP